MHASVWIGRHWTALFFGDRRMTDMNLEDRHPVRRRRGDRDRQAGGPAGRCAARRRDSVEARIDELSLGFKRPPVPMHRLDRDTSGCLLFARNPKARGAISSRRSSSGGLRKAIWPLSTARRRGDEGADRLPVGQGFERGRRLADGGRRGRQVRRDALAASGRGRRANPGRIPAAIRAARTRSASMRRAGLARRSSAIRSTACPTTPSLAG